METWNAIRKSQHNVNGYSKSLVLECESPNKTCLKTFIVKSVSDNPSEDISPIKSEITVVRFNGRDSRSADTPRGKSIDIYKEDLFSEIFSTQLAQKFNINVLTPAIIKLEPNFINENIDDLPTACAEYAVGIEYLENFPKTTFTSDIFEFVEQEASMLYAFDLLIFNADRKTNNKGKDPNCVILHETLIAYDFIESLGYSCTPERKFDSNYFNCGWITEHIFWPYLKGRTPNWEPFIKLLSTKLIEDELHDMVSKYPPEWCVKSRERIQFLLNASKNPEQFREGLDLSLKIELGGTVPSKEKITETFRSTNLFI